MCICTVSSRADRVQPRFCRVKRREGVRYLSRRYSTFEKRSERDEDYHSLFFLWRAVQGLFVEPWSAVVERERKS
jgi:hypothetical protein